MQGPALQGPGPQFTGLKRRCVPNGKAKPDGRHRQCGDDKTSVIGQIITGFRRVLLVWKSV